MKHLLGLSRVLFVFGIVTTQACSASDPNLVRVCDQGGCSMRDRATLGSQLEADLPEPKATDADIYRGENPSDLEPLAAGGDAVAAHKLGLVSYFGLAGRQRDHHEAGRHFASAAEQGLAASQFRLAVMHRTGDGVAKDPARALSLLHASAGQRYAPAAYELGAWYVQGDATGSHPAEGFRWCLVAAEQGIPEAQHDVALMYYRGQGTRQDSYEALQWFRRAAGNGSLAAQGTLGRIYFEGLDSMGQDLDESERWLQIAAGRGDTQAGRLLATVRRVRDDEAAYARARDEWREEQSYYLASLRYTYTYWVRSYWTPVWAFSLF